MATNRPASITVTPAGGDRWHVVVQAVSATAHEVTIPDGYLEKLGVGAIGPVGVLERTRGRRVFP